MDEPTPASSPGWPRSMTPLHGLCILLLLPPALACGYYLVLTAVALMSRPRTFAAVPARLRFAVVIPAHNEEAGIAAALLSCADLDYPRDLFRVFVIADNCTDATAAIARRHDVTVLDRHDLSLRGKGHALAWALPTVLDHQPDAVVLLDADCTVEPHALRSFADRLAAGQQVLQARVVTANPDVSPVSYAAAVGNLLENDLFYGPKDRLGGAVFLRGTGMVFTRAVLEAHPWEAYSLAEDSEFTLTLLRAGVAVRWVGDVTVLSDAPTDLSQLKVQRRRWAAALGHMNPAESPRGSIGLLRRCDARVTRLVMSRPLVLGATLLAATVAWSTWAWEPDAMAANLAWAAVTVLILEGLYLLLGIVLLGVTQHRLRLLAATPIVVGRLVGIAVRGMAGAAPRAWVRTPRVAIRTAAEV
jgi:1,2-diacylglycerol 3-beta-glucosyltransferase